MMTEYKTKVLVILYFIFACALIFILAFNRIVGTLLFRTEEYIVQNQKGSTLNVSVFEIDKTIKNEATKELFLVFKDLPNTYLTIAIPPKLIGTPNGDAIYNIYKNQVLYLGPSSRLFTPVNVGPEVDIKRYYISTDSIAFDSFGKIKILGETISLKKK